MCSFLCSRFLLLTFHRHPSRSSSTVHKTLKLTLRDIGDYFPTVPAEENLREGSAAATAACLSEEFVHSNTVLVRQRLCHEQLLDEHHFLPTVRCNDDSEEFREVDRQHRSVLLVPVVGLT